MAEREGALPSPLATPGWPRPSGYSDGFVNREVKDFVPVSEAIIDELPNPTRRNPSACEHLYERPP